jgi:hypothetical protein
VLPLERQIGEFCVRKTLLFMIDMDALCEQNAEFLILNLVANALTTGLFIVN